MISMDCYALCVSAILKKFEIRPIHDTNEGAIALSQNLQTQTSHTNNMNYVISPTHITVHCLECGKFGQKIAT